LIERDAQHLVTVKLSRPHLPPPWLTTVQKRI